MSLNRACKPAVLLALSLASCDAPDRRTADVQADTPAETARVASNPATALRAALETRLAGPRSPNDTTWFSEATRHALRDVQVDSAGNAIVDFHDLRPLIPNASSSAGSQILLDDLNEVVFGFPAIRSVEYRMDGSCDLFWEWLQYGCQRVEAGGRTRP